MPTILPADPTYRLQSTALTAVTAIAVQYLLAIPPSNQLDLYRTAATLLLPTVTFSFLQNRYVTLQRVAALRLSLPLAEYKRATSGKAILTANGMSTIFLMLSATALLSNLPLVYSRLMDGNVAGWLDQAGGPVAWFFAVVNVTVVVVCWVMMFMQDEMTFSLEESVKDDEVPLEKLRKTKGDAWTKLARTSRRHDVWVKPVRLPNGDEVGVFELTTRLASNHPLFNPDHEDRPSGPVLRVSLP